MKKLIALLALVSAPALAYTPVATQAILTPHGAQATACNTYWGFPVACSVTAYGQFPNGVWVHQTINLVLPYGACNTAVVIPPYGTYFINAAGTAWCN